MKTYDVIIIGAGSAGLSARKEVSKFTENYLVVDSGVLGTTCARVGCMPSKVFIEAVHIFHQSKKFSIIGAMPATGFKLDSSLLLQHVRKLRDHFVDGVKLDMQVWKASHLVQKKARFVTKNVLDLDGEQVTGKKIIIATGSSAIVPTGWALSEKVLTTDSFFEQPSFAKKMAVIGMGAIGLELGQALALAGSQVVIFGMGDTIGGGLSDPEMVTAAKKIFSEDMTLVEDSVSDIQVESDSVSLKHSGQVTKVDQVLVAIGRKPNLEGLGLEVLGIKLDAAGLPKFSRETFRIEGTEIYLVGDVNRDRALLHEASEQGRIAGYNSVQSQDEEFQQKVPLAITFTNPHIASVGLSYKNLKSGKINFVEGSVRFENQGRAVARMENKGILKVFANPETGLLLGAEIFAPDGEHLAHLLAWSLDGKTTVFDLLERPFYHPVIEEGLRTALRNLSKKIKISCPESQSVRCADPPAGK